jgi:hypothetical protein
MKFAPCLIKGLTYPTPEELYPSQSLRQPEYPEIRTHAYWLAEAPYEPTLLENTRTTVGSRQENPRGWRGAEVGGAAATVIS